MSIDEATQFELNPDAELIIRLRYWDDMAKELHIPVDNLADLKDKALKHLGREIGA
jgi:2-amino-1-hydroxyethylphosphonate dioxygenase (glycine-forming)